MLHFNAALVVVLEASLIGPIQVRVADSMVARSIIGFAWSFRSYPWSIHWQYISPDGVLDC